MSLRGQLETLNGFQFLSHRISLRGIELDFGKNIWELSGELDFDLDTSTFDPREIEGELSLENETVRRLGLLSATRGVFFYKIELLPRGDNQSEVVEVILHNSDQTKRNLGGWTIKGSGMSYKITGDRIIPAEGNLVIGADSGLIDESKPVFLVNPQGGNS